MAGGYSEKLAQHFVCSAFLWWQLVSLDNISAADTVPASLEALLTKVQDEVTLTHAFVFV